MFILGMEDADFEMAMQNRDYKLLNKHLYRVQKIAKSNYMFRLHIETTVDDKYISNNGEMKKNAALSMQMKKMINIRSFGGWLAQHPHKVRVNLLGEISEV